MDFEKEQKRSREKSWKKIYKNKTHTKNMDFKNAI